MTWQVEQAKDASHAPIHTNRQLRLEVNQFEQEYLPDRCHIRVPGLI